MAPKDRNNQRRLQQVPKTSDMFMFKTVLAWIFSATYGSITEYHWTTIFSFIPMIFFLFHETRKYEEASPPIDDNQETVVDYKEKENKRS